MTSTAAVWVTILVGGALTLAVRSSFLLAARHMSTVPPGAARVLRMIPAAALGALVVPALIRPEGVVDLAQPRLWAGALAALAGWRSGNVIVTLVVGLSSLILFEQLGW